MKTCIGTPYETTAVRSQVSPTMNMGAAMKDPRKVAAGLAAASLLLAACGSTNDDPSGDGSATADPVSGGVLKIGISQDIGELDPGVNTGVTYQAIKMQALYNTLYTWDADLEMKPDLAESWEQPDDTTYVFQIRDGVTFHTGRPMTAADVEYSLEWQLNEEKVYARELSKVVGADEAEPGADIPGITATDDTTLEIKLSEPFAPFLNSLYTIPIIDEETVDEIATHPVGTGPFKFKERVENDRLVLERYDGYWEEGKPYLDGVELRVIPDVSAAYANVKSGELDAIFSLEPRDAQNVVGDDPEVRIVEAPSTDLVMLHLVIDGNPALEDVHARRALAHCVDKDAINELVYSGFGEQQWSPIPSATAEYDPSVEELGYEYSVDLAKEELAQSGTPDGFDLTYTALSGLKASEDVATIWKQCLDQIGVNLKIETLEFATWLEKYDNFTYDVLFNFGALPPDPYRGFEIFYTAAIHGTPEAPQTSWVNDEMWELMNVAATGSEAERTAAYQELQRMTVEEVAPTIYVQQNPTLTAVDADVVGYEESYNPLRFLAWADIWKQQ